MQYMVVALQGNEPLAFGQYATASHLASIGYETAGPYPR
jgi:hypothetical protein